MVAPIATGETQSENPEVLQLNTCSKIGQGGFGRVYRVQEIESQREYALKVLTCSSQEEFLRAKQEIIAMQRFCDASEGLNRSAKFSNVAQLLRYDIVAEDKGATIEIPDELTHMKFPGYCVVLLLMEHANEGSLSDYLAKMASVRQPGENKSALSVDEICQIAA